MTLLTRLLPGPSVQWSYVHVPVEWNILHPVQYKLFRVCKTPEAETSSPSFFIHEIRLLCKALISSAKCFLTLERHKRKVREGAFIYLYGSSYTCLFRRALASYWLAWVMCFTHIANNRSNRIYLLPLKVQQSFNCKSW